LGRLEGKLDILITEIKQHLEDDKGISAEHGDKWKLDEEEPVTP
jgi:hypothetical protein